MLRMTAREIAAATDARLASGDPDRVAASVEIDSRTVDAGDCFFAIEGHRDDGHRYLEQAAAAGASVVVVHRPVDPEPLRAAGDPAVVRAEDTTDALQALARHVRDRVDPRVVGITGSIGKTTTKALTVGLVNADARLHASPGNLNNQWGVPLSLLGLEPGHRIMVAELGMSAPGEILALARLVRPDVGVITNVAPVHMEFFEDLSGVAAAKEELAEALDDDATLIVNRDDPRTTAMGERHRPRVARVLGFGRTEAADVRALEAEAGPAGWRLRLACPGEEPADVELPLHGEHSLENFLAAAAVAHALGIEATTMAERAPRLDLPSMRGRMRRLACGVTVIDDSYNASPRAMMSALDNLASQPAEGRRVFAAGDMLELGCWAEDAHREVGLHAAQLGIDLMVTVGPLARDIARGAEAGGFDSGTILSFSTSGEAAEALVDELRPGDLVLVKGSRAMQMERIPRALQRSGTGSRAAEAAGA